MPTRHTGFDDAADVVFQRVERGRNVEMQIQTAMVHALQSEDNFGVLRDLSDPGEAGHAA